MLTRKQCLDEPIPPPSLASLQSLVAGDLARVNDVILSRAQSDVPLILQIAQHIIASGGKRLRPALTLITSSLCGYRGDRHIELAACVELIHTATLLHDDVVDESKLRRGAATANDLWGNKSSVLVGDYLLSLAFRLMVADGSLKILKILSEASSVIAQGEVMQMQTLNEPETTAQQYFDVVHAKTAALFAAACEIGAVLGEKEQDESALRAFGMALGVAFQLTDDALDYSARQATLGKEIGDDFREGKATLPVILAYAKCDAKERQFWHRTLKEHDQRPGDLETAMQMIERHGGIAETLAQAETYCQKARNQLSGFPGSRERAALLEAVDFCVQRAY